MSRFLETISSREFDQWLPTFPEPWLVTPWISHKSRRRSALSSRGFSLSERWGRNDGRRLRLAPSPPLPVTTWTSLLRTCLRVFTFCFSLIVSKQIVFQEPDQYDSQRGFPQTTYAGVYVSLVAVHQSCWFSSRLAHIDSRCRTTRWWPRVFLGCASFFPVLAKWPHGAIITGFVFSINLSACSSFRLSIYNFF